MRMEMVYLVVRLMLAWNCGLRWRGWWSTIWTSAHHHSRLTTRLGDGATLCSPRVKEIVPTIRRNGAHTPILRFVQQEVRTIIALIAVVMIAKVSPSMRRVLTGVAAMGCVAGEITVRMMMVVLRMVTLMELITDITIILLAGIFIMEIVIISHCARVVVPAIQKGGLGRSQPQSAET